MKGGLAAVYRTYFYLSLFAVDSDDILASACKNETARFSGDQRSVSDDHGHTLSPWNGRADSAHGHIQPDERGFA